MPTPSRRATSGPNTSVSDAVFRVYPDPQRLKAACKIHPSAPGEWGTAPLAVPRKPGLTFPSREAHVNSLHGPCSMGGRAEVFQK